MIATYANSASARIAAAVRCGLVAAGVVLAPAVWEQNTALAQDDGHASATAEDGEVVHPDEAELAGAGPLSWKSDLAIWTLFVFLLLLLVLWKFAWGPIRDGLDRREQGIADNIAAAEQQNQKAKELLAQYEQKLAAAQDKVRAVIEEARRDAEHTQREILAQARKEARAERDRSLREIEMATTQALKELAESSANLAIDLAGKVVREKLDAADRSRLVDEAVRRFSESSASQN